MRDPPSQETWIFWTGSQLLSLTGYQIPGIESRSTRKDTERERREEKATRETSETKRDEQLTHYTSSTESK